MILAGDAAVGAQLTMSVQVAFVAVGAAVLVTLSVLLWSGRPLLRTREASRPPESGLAPSLKSPQPEAADDPLARLRTWHEFHSKYRRLRASPRFPIAESIPSLADRATIRLRRRSNRSGARGAALVPSRQPIGRPNISPDQAPCGPEPVSGPVVSVLGQITIAGIDRRLTDQQTALLTLLAVLGPQTRERLIDRIWDGRTVSRSRFANLITEIRGVVGKERLVLRDIDGRYQLNGISCDYLHFNELLNSTSDRTSESESTATLNQALDLIRGRLFEHRGSRYWHWLDDEHHLSFDAGRSVVTAATRLADIAAESGDHANALWACRQGLLAVPGDPHLLALAERLNATCLEGLWTLGDRCNHNV